MVLLTGAWRQPQQQKNGPSLEGPICLGSLWLGECIASALWVAVSANLRVADETHPVRGADALLTG